jgi:predicted Zn-dependent protease
MAGNEGKAKSLFDELFQQYPAAANAHLLYGFLLFERHPKQAAQEFKQELEVAPSNAGANVMLAWAYLMQNDSSGALPYAEKAEQEQPELPISQLVLGRSLVGTGDVKEGTQYLEKARLLDPSNPEIHIALAKAYSEAGRKEDAWRERMESLQLTSAQTTPTANP